MLQTAAAAVLRARQQRARQPAAHLARVHALSSHGQDLLQLVPDWITVDNLQAKQTIYSCCKNLLW